MELSDRFNTLASKIGQIKSMISTAAGEEAPDLLNLNLILNVNILDIGTYSLILSPSECKFEKGESPFAGITMISDENTWNEIFDGKITLFGAFTSDKIKVNRYRSNRFNLFLLSGMISFLLNMKIKL